MAWVVPRHVITEQHVALLKQHLWLTPKAFHTDAEALAVRAYTTTDTTVALPYFYGRLLFPNDRLPRTISFPAKMWYFKGDLRPHQHDLVRDVIGHLQQYNTALLNAFCAAGKTVMGAYVAAYVNYLTYNQRRRAPIIVTFVLKTLKPQWLNTFSRFTTAVVHLVDSTPTVPPDADIYLTMIDGLKKLPAAVRDSCQLLVLDEAHMFCTELRLNEILKVNADKILLLTATVQKANGLETILQLFAGTHIVQLEAAIPMDVWHYNTGITPPPVKNKQGVTDWGKMVKYITSDSSRNDAIVKWVRDNPTRKWALITTRKEHARELHKRLTECGESASLLIGSTEFYKPCRVLVIGVKKGGTGFDEAGQCLGFKDTDRRIDTVGICVSLKAELVQAIGRGFRALSRPQFVHFMDGGKIFDRHWGLHVKWCSHPVRKDIVKIFYTTTVVVLPEEAPWVPAVETEEAPEPLVETDDADDSTDDETDEF